ncbi:MAG TPA: sensor histidine kinase, partial [Chthoniobacteraceae bacterium]|nr:sensor histidine kinase [Chthoniobacteraceae bacterium]
SYRLLTSHEDERRRVARELHDDITQRLARLSMDAAKLELCKGEIPCVARSIKQALATLSEDAHSLAYRLHPAVLEELGLPDALAAECERFSKANAITVNIDQRGSLHNLPLDIALCLFRIAQEGLRNIARHAQASQVDVTLVEIDRGVQLALRDDGVGFTTNVKPLRPSLGIPGMKERVALLGGEIDIESSPGHGTAIVAWMPLNERTFA